MAVAAITEVSRIHAVSETNETFKKIYPSIRISRHVMAVIDARPLFSLPFYDIPRTTFDNWEEKFRPADWVEEISIVEESVAPSVISVAKSKLTAGSSDDESVEGESLIEEESAVESAVSIVEE